MHPHPTSLTQVKSTPTSAEVPPTTKTATALLLVVRIDVPSPEVGRVLS